VRRVYLVADVGLVILDLEAAGLEQLSGATGETDLDDRVGPAVGDEGSRSESVLETWPPTVDDRNEAAEGENPCHRRPVGPQGHRVAHHGPHRETAEHSAGGLDPGLLPEPVVKVGQGGAGGVEGVVVGVADPGNQIPVVAGGPGQLQWPLRGDHPQPPLRIEGVRKAEQIPRVGPATVVEDQEAVRLARGRSLEEGKRLDRGHPAQLADEAAVLFR
jgi:hypothetical protein